tara:strand:- start:6759 stop:6992 length:234 start_codon:yes stop_codon:yes gene_type:complete
MMGLQHNAKRLVPGDVVQIRDYYEDEGGVMGYTESSGVGMIIASVCPPGKSFFMYEVLYDGHVKTYARDELVVSDAS